MFKAIQFNVKTLALFLILSMPFINGCKKEELTNTTEIQNANNNQKPLNTTALSVADAQNYFTNSFGSSKTIFKSNSVSTALHLRRNITITPVWSLSQISTYLNTQPVLFVPVHSIPLLDEIKAQYSLFFYRDSANNIVSKLFTYLPDSLYAQTHTLFDVNTFTGAMFLIDMDGSTNRILVTENGRFTKVWIPSNMQGREDDEDCQDPVRCPRFGGGRLRNIFDGSGWNSFINWLTSGNNSGGGGGGGSPIIINGSGNVIGIDGNGDVGNGVGGSGDGGSGSQNLNSEIDNTLFETSAYSYYENLYRMQMGFSDVEFEDLYFNRRLFTQVEHYFVAYGRSQEDIEAVRAHKELLLLLEGYSTANSNNGFHIDIIYYLKIFTQYNFTPVEFGKLLQTPDVFNSVRNIIVNNSLNNDEKINIISEFRRLTDWNNLVSQNPSPITQYGTPDPLLDFNAFSNYPYFIPLRTIDIRNMIQTRYPHLEQYKINISAGVALENAYAYTSRCTKATTNVLALVRAQGPRYFKNRLTRPDFISPTFYSGNDEELVFPYGCKIEVKVPQNMITLATNNWQIAAEISMASSSTSTNLLNLKYAGDKKAAAYILVLPWGTQVDPAVTQHCTELGVNFYISYAFIGANQEIVFCNPIRQNNIVNEAPLPSSAVLSRGAYIDYQRATVYWNIANDTERNTRIGQEINNDSNE